MMAFYKLGILGLGALFLSACQSTWVGQTNTAPAAPLTWQTPKPVFMPNMSVSERIAQVALDEHKAWQSSFIDKNGHLLRYRVPEGEHSAVGDEMVAWQRVMMYWQDSGALETLPAHQRWQCVPTGTDSRHNRCRYHAMDVAWSAAFISYVMHSAGVPTFKVSALHFDYIKQAWQGVGAYHMADPLTTAPKVGDMLCYLRGQAHIQGYAAFDDYLKTNERALPAHCDVVVRVGADEVQLVGGNVINTVMLRKLPKDGATGLIQLPSDTTDEGCAPDNEVACNFNRQNWVALLQLTV